MSEAPPVAIISDLHANAAALLAVQRDLRTHGVREIWCLGDLVGYGPHVSAVMAVVLRNRGRWVTVAGNHDDYICRVHRGQVELDAIKASRNARAAIRRQMEMMAPEELEQVVTYLEGLPTTARPRDDILLVHPKDASLPIYPGSDLVENHILGRQEHAALRELIGKPSGRLIVMRGHTHRPVCFVDSPDGWQDVPPEGTIELKGRDAWINPGSVGESRVKGDPRAFYCLYRPPPEDTITFVRLPYRADAVGRECERLDIPVRPAWRGGRGSEA